MLPNLHKLKRLEGTWYHPDTSAEFRVRVLQTKVAVSGVDNEDGERFTVSNVEWDGQVLSFTSVMPSTGWTVDHRLTPNRGGTLKHEFSCREIWKRRT